ncbi:MAG: DUF302 domain-containing protein [Rhodospirillaceae bacterium]
MPLIRSVTLGLAALLLASMTLLQSPTAKADGTKLVSHPGWVVLETPYGFDDLVQRVQQSVKDQGMYLVTQASASQGAKGRGLTIPGNRIVGVYRNDYALRMLEADLAAGIEAPIRFYLTEDQDEDGGSTLSYKTPSTVFAPYMADGGAALKTLAEELDQIFAEMAERAVK